MTKCIKTSNPEVLDMLKGIGAPENCTGVKIEFPGGGVVTVEFNTVLSDGQYQVLKGFLADKTVVIPDAK